MLRNTPNQGVFLFARVLSTGVGAPGDAANITGAWSLDGTDHPAGFAATNPTEMSGGAYWQPLAQAETDGDSGLCRWSSSTSGVVITERYLDFTLRCDGTIASATAITLTLPDTDSRGAPIPDDGRYANFQLRVVAGTGAGQVPLLTTATGAPWEYNILDGTCPVTLDATSQFQFAGTISSRLDLSQPVPTANTAETVGDALNAARADGFGSWSITGSAAPYTVTMFAADGTTPVHSFQIDSLTAPLSRS